MVAGAPLACAVAPSAEIAATPAAKVRHRTVAVGEIEFFYREAGPADAPTVLLLHGYPT